MKKPMIKPFKITKRSLKYGALSTALTAVFIVAVLLVNILVGILGEKVNLKFDLTNQKIYEISQDTKDYINTLQNEVNIYICTAESNFDSTSLEIIQKYEKISDKIHFQAMDVTLNPDFAKQYPNESLTTNSIIVAAGDHYKVLTTEDLYAYNSDQSGITGIKAEQKITSAIMYVTSDDIPIAYFTEGHEEYSPTVYRQMCEDNNLQVEDINLITGMIDERAQYLVIFRPQTDFSVEELRALEDFADKGDKNILVYMDAQVPELPNLNAFLSEWGLSVQPSIILDSEKYITYPSYLIAQYGSSDITANLVANKQLSILPNSCPVNILFESSNGYTTFPILTTYDSAYVKTGEIKAQTDIPMTDADIPGPFTIAAGASKSYSGSKIKTTNIMVFGSAAVAADSYLETTSAGNAELVLNATLYGKETEDMISITPKYFDDTSFMVTAAQAQGILVAFVIVLPVAILAVGVVMWLKRRNK